MNEPMTPAQVERREYEEKTTALATIRADQFQAAPTYIPQEGEWAALKELARAICITEFVPKEMRGRPFAVLGALLMGRELGVPPVSAIRRIPVINGRPSMETAVKVALVRQKGHRVRVLEWDTEHCKVQGWRKGDPVDEVMEVTYTMDDAKIAGDYDKGDTYKKRPRQMMYARSAGLLCDTYFSDVTLGLPGPDDVADLPGEVIEARFVEADRRGEMPAMPTDTPLTPEEHAAEEERRLERGRERMAASPPPPPPRTRGRGKGPRPDPQQGSDSGASGPAAATTSAATTAQPSAASSSSAGSPAGDPPLVSDAQMARDLGLEDVAEALERGETPPPSPADVFLAGRRAAETADTAPGGPPATLAGVDPAPAPQRQGDAAKDPFGDEPEPADDGKVTDISGLIRLRQQGLDYAMFLTRRKLERDRKPAAGTAQLQAEAQSRLDQVARQMVGHPWTEASEAELQDTLVPWLRQRYASEGGPE